MTLGSWRFIPFVKSRDSSVNWVFTRHIRIRTPPGQEEGVQLGSEKLGLNWGFAKGKIAEPKKRGCHLRHAENAAALLENVGDTQRASMVISGGTLWYSYLQNRSQLPMSSVPKTWVELLKSHPCHTKDVGKMLDSDKNQAGLERSDLEKTLTRRSCCFTPSHFYTHSDKVILMLASENWGTFRNNAGSTTCQLAVGLRHLGCTTWFVM